LPDVDVHAFYADGWIHAGGLRVNFVASVDGAAQAAGKSAGLQTPGDNRVFAALRDLADVVLVGAGTARSEGYRAISLSERRRAIRREYGLTEQLPTALMSRNLSLDPASALFAGPVRTLVLTCEAAPNDRRSQLAEVADVILCGTHTVEPELVRDALRSRGLIHILSEGGPQAFADLARGGVVDELCLSISPMLIGGGPTRIAAGERAFDPPLDLQLAGLLEEDGALFARYRMPGRMSSRS
jgi:riboflavin biosynthesis pyrimidine reductase